MIPAKLLTPDHDKNLTETAHGWRNTKVIHIARVRRFEEARGHQVLQFEDSGINRFVAVADSFIQRAIALEPGVQGI